MNGAAVVPDRFAVIGWAYGLPDGAVALSALGAAGIPAHSSARHLASVASPWMVALGGIDLRVPAALAPMALEILTGGNATSERRGSLGGRLCIVLLFLVASVPPPARGLFLRTAPAVSRCDRAPPPIEG
ncbi:hypothetical protein [Aureimonas pseudogalii]|uniref:Uncharacterized protein n=1 Tax=Aureimonas pseudogalii TaxID=1744844 RepID=A0A7W6H818_9HYPH|nr:hypothetical protein [Aureimonas pseudogalii]MBB4000202.1 hypothetical protein [Aureimonas pseudogalii]